MKNLINLSVLLISFAIFCSFVKCSKEQEQAYERDTFVMSHRFSDPIDTANYTKVKGWSYKRNTTIVSEKQNTVFGVVQGDIVQYLYRDTQTVDVKIVGVGEFEFVR